MPLPDVRYAVRRLLARPGLVVVVAGSLAIGIGANSMVFSLVSGLLLGGGAYPEPDRVAMLWFTPPGEPGARVTATDANCAVLRERARSFAHVGCVRPGLAATLADLVPGAPAPERLVGQAFTPGVAEALGTPPVAGRWFTREEAERGDPVVLISHRLWQRRYGGAPDVVGRQVRATHQGAPGDAATIIGVLPERFELIDARTDYWVPLAVAAGSTNPARHLLVLGRLAPGVTRAQAQAEMDVVAGSLADDLPLTNSGWGISVERIQDTLRSGLGAPLLILQGIVAFVLLIACANIAGRILADSATRHREMAVRCALGSGRWRLVRLLLIESLLLSTLGAAVGLVLAHHGLRLLVMWLPANVPGLSGVSLDIRVLAFTAALAVLTGVGVGLAPALQASGRDPAAGLRNAPGTNAAPHRRLSLRRAVVATQIALALIASIGAGLMLNSLVRLRAVDVGIETAGLMTFQVQLAGGAYIRDTGIRMPTGAPQMEITPQLRLAAEQIRQGLAGIPGAGSATAVAAMPPVSGFARIYTVDVPGAAAAGSPDPLVQAQWFPVLPQYFETLGVPVVRGRGVAAADTGTSLPVAVINRTMAERFWSDEDPVGQHIRIGVFNEPRRQIVGVVADVRQSARQQQPLPQVYVPFSQVPAIQSAVAAQGLESLTYVVRFPGDPAPFAPAVRRVVADVDPHQPVSSVQPLEQYVSNQLAGFREYVILLVTFGVVAVALAAAGIAGAMGYAVQTQRNEIAIRMALGATRREVLWLVLREGLLLTGIGLVPGLAGALALTRLLEGFLWEVTATDPVTFAAVFLVLGAVAILSCYIPARRAIAINPAEVLQQT